MHRVSSSCCFVLAAILTLPAGARAELPEAYSGALAAPSDSAQLPLAASEPETPEPTQHEFGVIADDGVLAGTRGGSDLTTIDTTLTGTVSGNSANNVFTGANIIQGGSFANMSGIPIIVQNTGANVLIQNATVINLQLK